MSNNAPDRFDSLYPVQFDGDTLVLAAHDGEPHVVMRPVVDSMGMDWASQYVKLNDKFASTVVIITTVGEDGKKREMVSLPLKKFPAWLYSVNPSKVSPNLREKIVRYQEECDEVLWQYWTQGYAGRPTLAPTIDQQLRAHQLRLRLIGRLQKEKDAAARKAIHDQLISVSDLLRLETPQIDLLGQHIALPTVPWKWVISCLIAELGERQYAGVYERDVVQGEDCLLIRLSQVIPFLMESPEIAKTLSLLPLQSPRALRKALEQEGLVVGECERMISGKRVGHLLALSVEKLAAFGVLLQ